MGAPTGDSPAAGAPAPPTPPVRVVREVDLDPRSVVWILATFVAVIAFTGLVRSIPRTVTALAVATILALALDPVVGAVERRAHVRRAVAVGMVLSAFAALVVAVALLLIPPAIRQGRDLGHELPRVVRDLGTLPVVGDDLLRNDVPDKVEEWIRQLPSRLQGDTTPIENAGKSFADGLLAASVTLLLAVTLLLDGQRLLGGVRRMVPRERRAQADRVGEVAYRVVGRYVAGSLSVAAVAGLFILTVGLVLGVPITPLAAVWVALWDLVPQVGGAVGGIPFVLLAFTKGAGTGVLCGGLFIVYLQIENHIMQPVLVGQAVKLSPPATMTAALIGVSAGGLVGALLAVPLVGSAKAIYLEVRPPP